SALGPPERLAAGRVRGPDDHRAVGGDGAGWPGPGPGGALGPVGPDPVAGAGVGRDPPATGISRRGSSRARAPTARSVAWWSTSIQAVVLSAVCAQVRSRIQLGRLSAVRWWLVVA